MEIFPLLSTPPVTISTDREEGTLSSNMEAGYVVTRYKFTRPMRRKWSLGYELLNDNDENLLTSFVDTVRGPTDIFLWRHPVIVTGQYTVRFEKAPVVKLMDGIYDGGNRWSTDFVLVQV